MVSEVVTWNDTPGSTILKLRQFEDIPEYDFLMHPQGFFSGKTVGDLHSVPGYYGATTDKRFVQNARAVTNIRRSHAKHNVQRYGTLSAPFEKRLEAYRAAALLRPKEERPVLKSKAHGPRFKFADQYGARFSPRQVAASLRLKDYYERKQLRRPQTIKGSYYRRASASD